MKETAPLWTWPRQPNGQPYCRHCFGNWMTIVWIESSEEYPDGSEAPQVWTWECLRCHLFTETLEKFPFSNYPPPGERAGDN